MKIMKLLDIKINESFEKSIPQAEKMEMCRNYWNNYGKQDRYIVVNHNNILIDGYIQYLILKENNIKEVEVQVSNKVKKKWARKNRTYRELETAYIFGVHLNSNNIKEYVWRVPNSWWSGWADILNIGDILLVKTKYGLAPIKITQIKRLSKCPVNIPVKTVVKKL